MHEQDMAPEVLAEEVRDDAVTLRMRLPAGLFWFQGHFPGQPVLPGVAQLGWVTEAVARIAPGAVLREIEQVKFMRPMVPGDEAQLAVRKVSAGDPARFAFEYCVLREGALVPASKGRVLCGTKP